MHSQVAAITNSSSEAYVAPPFSGGDVWGMITDEAARLITAGDQDVLAFCGDDAVFLEGVPEIHVHMTGTDSPPEFDEVLLATLGGKREVW